MARAFTCAAVLLFASSIGAQTFDDYVNPVLNKVPTAKGVKEVAQLTPDLITDHDRIVPKVFAAFVVVRTNDGRNSKLLVQSARQKVGEDKIVPVLHIERYVTYREGEERRITASGEKMSLFPGFRFSLDLGQVVPDGVPADVRFVVDGGKVFLEPVGKAKLYLLTQALPEAVPAKTMKVVVKEPFEPKYFAGAYKLYDDGRRSGTLKLEVDAEGGVTGSYFSDRDGAKYEVRGKVGGQPNAITFTIKFPRSEQVFTGWMFTGDGKAITGYSQLTQHESGFYAVRVDE